MKKSILTLTCILAISSAMPACAWDSELVPGEPPTISQILELKKAIDAKRTSCAKEAYPWTESIFNVPSYDAVRPQHINQLRLAIKGLYGDDHLFRNSIDAPARAGEPILIVRILEMRKTLDEVPVPDCG